jgi:hypothetical protein
MEHIDDEMPGFEWVGVGLTKAIETAGKAYVAEAYKEEWPKEDRKTFKLPEWKVRALVELAQRWGRGDG